MDAEATATTPDPNQLTRDYLLRDLLVEVRKQGALLARVEARQEETGDGVARLITSSQHMASHVLKVFERQKKDRERIRALENVVFHGAPAVPGPPPMAWAPRPPMPSVDDSAVHDIEALKQELAGIKPHVESSMRRDSWFYRQRWSLVFRVAVIVATAGGSALFTYLLSHLR